VPSLKGDARQERAPPVSEEKAVGAILRLAGALGSPLLQNDSGLPHRPTGLTGGRLTMR
jgi:hypothetical protein